MNNNELNDWIAINVMDWVRDGAYYRNNTGEITRLAYGLYQSPWEPCTILDHTQMVLQKAFLQNKEIPNSFDRFLAYLNETGLRKCEYNTQEVHNFLVMVTPREICDSVYKTLSSEVDG